MAPGAALLRLTLRSSTDGHLLARVIEREGTAFVLDYGDPRVVAEASRLVLQGGFKVRWQDREETAVSGSPSMLRQLALHFAAQGHLVFVDEPDFPRRALPPAREAASDAGPPTLYPDDPSGHDMDTEILSREDLARRAVRRFHQAATEEVEIDDQPVEAMVEWEETEEVPMPSPPRRG
ncbi:MAG: hypothetical protein H6735_18555 [Alphaproteobacteria bacterium]|nr:hypothetical protein [Alphaproteobacteria bacterium]